MIVVRSVAEYRRLRADLQGSVGFVATMGALHAGHLSLVSASMSRCDHTVASIFVNPTQFNDSEDLKGYPVDMERDLRQLEDASVNVAFVPDNETLYPDHYRFKVVESEFSHFLSGATRPGHFDGVLTVVLRLLNIVQPDIAFFGEKDYQQYLLIRDMVTSFFMDVRIEMVPTVRNERGVALSSRNGRLTSEGMDRAAVFARELANGPDPAAIREALEQSGIRVEYIEEIDGRRYGSVVIENVVLIDNVRIGGQPTSR